MQRKVCLGHDHSSAKPFQTELSSRHFNYSWVSLLFIDSIDFYFKKENLYFLDSTFHNSSQWVVTALVRASSNSAHWLMNDRSIVRKWFLRPASTHHRCSHDPSALPGYITACARASTGQSQHAPLTPASAAVSDGTEIHSGGGRRCHNWSAREHHTGSTSSLWSFRHVRLTLINIRVFILPLVRYSPLLTFRNATISWQKVIKRVGSSIRKLTMLTTYRYTLSMILTQSIVENI